MGKKKKIYELKLYKNDDGTIIHKSKFININKKFYEMQEVLDVLSYHEFVVGCTKLLAKIYGAKYFNRIIVDENIIDIIDSNLDLGAIYWEIMNGDPDDIKSCLSSQQFGTNDLNLRNLKFDFNDDIDALNKLIPEFLEVAKKRFDRYIIYENFHV